MRITMVSNERKCIICGEDDPRLLELHHIFSHGVGEQVLLCKNDHFRITHDQNLLSPHRRSRKANKEDKLAYELVSIGSLLELVGKKLKQRGLDKYG